MFLGCPADRRPGGPGRSPAHRADRLRGRRRLAATPDRLDVDLPRFRRRPAAARGGDAAGDDHLRGRADRGAPEDHTSLGSALNDTARRNSATRVGVAVIGTVTAAVMGTALPLGRWSEAVTDEFLRSQRIGFAILAGIVAVIADHRRSDADELDHHRGAAELRPARALRCPGDRTSGLGDGAGGPGPRRGRAARPGCAGADGRLGRGARLGRPGRGLVGLRPRRAPLGLGLSPAPARVPVVARAGGRGQRPGEPAGCGPVESRQGLPGRLAACGCRSRRPRS